MKKLKLTNEEKQIILHGFTSLLSDAKTPEDVNFKLSEHFTKIKNASTPTILIDATVKAKMESLVKKSATEISWHGLVKKHNNRYFIYDIIMFPQTNTAASTTTDQDEYAKWMTELMKDEKFNFEDMRMHGHSHVNMSVYSSSIDDAYQKDLLTKLEDGDYYIFLILNKRNEVCALLYDYEQNILFEDKDIEIKVVDTTEGIIDNWADTQIKKYCSVPKYRSVKTTFADNDGFNYRKKWWKK